jgi:hypothetical protein
MYQINGGLIKADRRVINRGAANPEQLALARQAQSVFSLRPLIDTAYRLPGSGRAHRFSPCDKKSFSTANWPISPLTHASMCCRATRREAL